MKKPVWLILLLGCLGAHGQTISPEQFSHGELVEWLKENTFTQPDLVRSHIGYIAEEARQNADDSTKIYIYHYLAYVYYLRQQYGQDSIKHYQLLSIEAARNLGDSSLVAAGLRELAAFLRDSEQPEEGRQYIFEALALYEEINDSAGIAFVKRTLCDFFRDAKQYEEALAYAREAIHFYDQSGNHRNADFGRLCELAALADMEDFESTIALSERMLKDRRLGVVPENSNTEFILGKKRWAQLQSGDTLGAIRTGTELLTLLGPQEEQAEQTGYLQLLADQQILKGQFSDAVSTLHQILDLQGPNHFIGDRSINRERLVYALRQTGAFKEALLHQDTLITIDQELHELELNQVRADLLYQYEKEQQDRTIDEQNELLTIQRKNQRLFQLLAGILIAGLLALGLVLYNNRKKNLQLAALNDDLQATNTQLDQRNAQNELLLKEIHHRVKNNLETVSSLLELQSAQVEDANAQSVMQASQSRVQSMSIIHQKLYQGENLAGIEMRDYFKNLGDSLLDNYNAWEQVSIKYDMPEIELDVDTAIPIGLIVNELLTNALKYAFPDGEKGKLHIQLKRQADNTLYLRVSDNGIGKQAGLSPKGTGFGSQLVQLLTRQLNGTMKESSEEGLRNSFVFKAAFPN